jgi:hypothetical protein
MNNHKPDNAELMPGALVTCPTCGLPADITDRFTLGGAPGPVDHVTVICVRRHWYTLPVDSPRECAGARTSERLRNRTATMNGAGERAPLSLDTDRHWARVNTTATTIPMTDLFAYHLAKDQLADLRRTAGETRLVSTVRGDGALPNRRTLVAVCWPIVPRRSALADKSHPVRPMRQPMHLIR